MTPQPIVIVGTGGSGRETLALLRDIEDATPGTWDFRGFLGTDEPEIALLERLEAPFVDSPFGLTQRIPKSHTWSFALGLGNSLARRAMANALIAQGLSAATLIHPNALIGPDVVLGTGVTVCANSVITTNVRIGDFCQVNIGCVIGHDARIGDFVTFAQSVNIAGNVTVKDYANLCTRSVVIPGLTVGESAVVGAGAVVISSVNANSTVVGIPARPVG